MDTFKHKRPWLCTGRQASSSFLKKRTKTLLSVAGSLGCGVLARSGAKVFWFFFSKKNCFLRACFRLQVTGLVSI
jgi:hypothetical protein